MTKKIFKFSKFKPQHIAYGSDTDLKVTSIKANKKRCALGVSTRLFLLSLRLSISPPSIFSSTKPTTTTRNHSTPVLIRMPSYSEVSLCNSTRETLIYAKLKRFFKSWYFHINNPFIAKSAESARKGLRIGPCMTPGRISRNRPLNTAKRHRCY